MAIFGPVGRARGHGWPHRSLRRSRFLIGLALLIGVAVVGPAGAGGSTGTGNPGGWRYLSGFPGSSGTSSDIAFYFNVHSYRGSTDDPIYTSHGLDFQNGQHGYTGLSVYPSGYRLIIFSIWDTVQGSRTVLPHTGLCARYGDSGGAPEGTGVQCRIDPASISNKKWYEISIRKTGRVDTSTQHGDVWTAALIDVAAGITVPIGSMLLLDNNGYQGYGGLLVGSSGGFVEYFGYGPGGGNSCSSRSAYDFEYYGPTFNKGTDVPTSVTRDETGCSSLTFSSVGRGYNRVAFNPDLDKPINVAKGVNFMSGVPSTAPENGVALHSSSGRLWTMQPAATDRGVAMMPGTSPSIAALPSGARLTAYHSQDGYLWVANPNAVRNTGLGMMQGTSPAIATKPGDYRIAFQSRGGYLAVTAAAATVNTGLGMRQGTSPSIASVPGGWEAAFQSNAGYLWVNGALAKRQWLFPMMHRTSPAIAACDGGYSVAAQTGNGHLWTLGRGDTGLAMMRGTSPSIACHSGTYLVAFQGSDGHLWTTSNAPGGPTTGPGLAMMPGTSPSITYDINGWTTVFHSSNGHLWAVGANGVGDTGVDLAPGTSPTID